MSNLGVQQSRIASELSQCVKDERSGIKQAMAEASLERSEKGRRLALIPAFSQSIARISPLLESAEKALRIGRSGPRAQSLEEAIAEAGKTVRILQTLKTKIASGAEEQSKRQDSTSAASSKEVRDSPEDLSSSTPGGGGQSLSINSLGAAIAGSNTLEPAHEIRGNQVGSGRRRIIVGLIDSKLLSQITFAPVARFKGSTVVAQRSQDGYQDHPDILETRRLAQSLRDGEDLPSAPVILNGRYRWQWNPDGDSSADAGYIQTFDSAAIVDGRKRIGAYSIAAREFSTQLEVPFILLPPLDIPTEMEIYELCHPGFAEDQATERVRRPSSAGAHNRLVVGIQPSEVELTSEPYVAVNTYGYAPVIDVLNLKTGEKQGLYVSAKSLAHGIEDHRLDQSTIVGMRLRLSKTGPERTAAYRVDRI